MARKGKMYDRTIDSKHLHESVTIKIYEPEQFDSLYEHNVIIMQDGDDYFHLGRIATVSDRLHDQFDIVNATFVGIPYKDRFDRWKKYHPNGEQFNAYKAFLHDEVVPLIDELLPLNPLGTIRTLLGDSLGGTVSLLAALDYPNMFQRVVMQSPYVDENVIAAVNRFDNIVEPQIFHTYGLAEIDVPTTKMGRLNFVKPNEQLAGLLSETFASYEKLVNPEGNHTWKYWQKELPDLLVKALNA